ncbi:hypothetical protein G5B31_13495 [Rhodobacter sp. SGA-6-6]|uniref:hypothetical protein n=1 Tax=Rhodobacter sp. SGA-6-6 TaxID=2710882 RepID=UPI0013EC5F9B|nr:hypothetical protein [Rhodobacter sp. SGA-6-6]NGM46550.1 hypothetical protein [Rhodobacter sp. SGA-6-6]
MLVLAEILAAPTAAEAALLAHAGAGTPCQFGTALPDPADAGAPRIRAALLAHLVTGGSAEAPVAPQGLRLIGAVVEGPLNLSFLEARGETDLRLCAFTDAIAARRARLVQLVLSGSCFPALTCEGATIEGSVFLIGIACPGRISFATAQIGGQLALHGAETGPFTAQGARIGASVYLRASREAPFRARGEVSLANAQIDGQLALDGATLDNFDGIALNAQGARIDGDVFLRDQGPHPFRARGEVRLAAAEIAGQLDCSTAAFAAPEGRAAFAAQRMQVEAEFFWQKVDMPSGSLHMPSAKVGDLVDDPASWPGAGRSYIDGFGYDRITRDAPVDAATRLRWLAQVSSHDGRFLPQPYAQCAATLARMGHEAEAREIMEAQARRKGIQRRRTRAALPDGSPRRGASRAWAEAENLIDWLWDRAAQGIVGYGYAPFRALGWITALALLAGFLAMQAWNEGSMAPNNDLIAASEGWQELLAQDCIPDPFPGCTANPAALWNGVTGPGLDWESFHPLAYGVDTVLPVVGIGQTAAWSPSKDRGPWGFTLWWARWPLIFAGWLVSALAAAAATGIIQRGTPT